MSGPDKSLQKAQVDSAQRSDAMNQELFAESKKNTQRMYDLQQPAIDFNTALSSGDKSATMTAAAPAISEITRSNESAKANIMNTLPPGAARDVALAQQVRQAPSQVSQFINSNYLASKDKLANIGSGLGAFSLQQLGGGLRAGEDASNNRNSVLGQQQAGKAATLGFIGSLAGAAGGAVTGGLSKGGAWGK